MLMAVPYLLVLHFSSRTPSSLHPICVLSTFVLWSFRNQKVLQLPISTSPPFQSYRIPYQFPTTMNIKVTDLMFRGASSISQTKSIVIMTLFLFCHPHPSANKWINNFLRKRRFNHCILDSWSNWVGIFGNIFIGPPIEIYISRNQGYCWWSTDDCKIVVVNLLS